MSFSRKQLLDEMGLAPQWVLREPSAVARGAAILPAAALAVSPMPKADAFLAAVADEMPACGAERSAQIASQGWEQLRQSIAACRACALCNERKQARVFDYRTAEQRAEVESIWVIKFKAVTP